MGMFWTNTRQDFRWQVLTQCQVNNLLRNQVISPIFSLFLDVTTFRITCSCPPFFLPPVALLVICWPQLLEAQLDANGARICRILSQSLSQQTGRPWSFVSAPLPKTTWSMKIAWNPTRTGSSSHSQFSGALAVRFREGKSGNSSKKHEEDKLPLVFNNFCRVQWPSNFIILIQGAANYIHQVTVPQDITIWWCSWERF